MQIIQQMGKMIAIGKEGYRPQGALCTILMFAKFSVSLKLFSSEKICSYI